jgi:hypothetical protein
VIELARALGAEFYAVAPFRPLSGVANHDIILHLDGTARNTTRMTAMGRFLPVADHLSSIAGNVAEAGIAVTRNAKPNTTHKWASVCAA